MDYLLAFSDQVSATVDPVMATHRATGSWRSDYCFPGVVVKSGGSPADTKWRILISRPSTDVALASHPNLELVIDRDRGVTSYVVGTSSSWSSRQMDPVPAGSLTNDVLVGKPIWTTPFNAQSLWKAQPVSPVLGTGRIPAANNNAWLEDGPFSTQVFYAKGDETPMTVRGAWVGDEIRTRDVVIPHWPASAVGAAGTDGHCEIYDDSTRTLHSFNGLKLVNGQWQASKYSTRSIDDAGWGSPSRPDGPRGAGVSTAGGLLRAWELGLPQFNHVLAVAANANVFVSGPVFPSTLEDAGLWASATGVLPNAFPYGTLFMLPASFDETQLSWPVARAIAKTLKIYGARLVDQTTGAFSFYGEIGAGWSAGMSQADLATIRNALRAVTSVSGWLDGNGNSFTPTPWAAMNLLSMRGPWSQVSGPVLGGSFDTVQNLYSFPASSGSTSTVKMILYERDNSKREPWFGWQSSQQWHLTPTQGTSYRLSAIGAGPVNAQINIKSGDFSTTYFASSVLAPGQTQTFAWPNQTGTVTEIYVSKAAGPAASFRLELQAA